LLDFDSLFEEPLSLVVLSPDLLELELVVVSPLASVPLDLLLLLDDFVLESPVAPEGVLDVSDELDGLALAFEDEWLLAAGLLDLLALAAGEAEGDALARGVAVALADAVALGEALAVADGEALAVADGEANGLADAAGVAVTLVDAALPAWVCCER